MRSTLLLLTAFVFLCSCADGVTAVPVAAQVPGWRTAGLEAPQRGEGDTQWTKLLTIGERMVALNTTGGMWISAGYSSGWKRIPWEVSQGIPYRMVALQDTLCASTTTPGKGRVYCSKIDEWKWVNQNVPIPESLGVDGLGIVKGRLIAFAVNVTSNYAFIRNGGQWTDFSQGFPRDVPFRLLEVGDTLWAGTWEDGLWYRVWGEASWKHQPAAAITMFIPGTAYVDTTFAIRGLAWHRGSLWMAEWGGETTEMPGGKAPYIAARNCPPNSVDPSCLRDLPVNLLTMISWKDRLITAGFFGSSGHVFDDSSRHWLPLEDSWCWNNYADCGGTRTRDLVGLGDTVYAATNRFIMKFPITELPKMSPALEARYHWPTDTSWKNKYLYVKNPPHQ
jgi:hypothetical protein